MPNPGDDPDDGANINWHNLHHGYMSNMPVQMPPDPLHQVPPQPPQPIGGLFHHQNDLYTMYANSVPPGMQGNFTMMPVGHGNYVQVFHQAESPEQQQVFNSYELFAPNSFIPHQAALHQLQQQQQQEHHHQQAQVANPDLSSQPTQNHYVSDTATNMFINRLATNWKPNVSGTYSPFGEQHSHLKSFGHVLDTPPQSSSSAPPSSPSSSLLHQSPANLEPPPLSASNVHVDKGFSSTPGNLNISNNTNGNLESNACSPTVANIVPEVRKQRIVAEVKPMRLSYSDVLSKNVTVNQQSALNETSSGNYSSSSESNLNVSGNKTLKSVADRVAKTGLISDEKKNATSETRDKSETKGKKFDVQSSFRNDDYAASLNAAPLNTKRKPNGEDSSRENGTKKTSKKSTTLPNKKWMPKSLNNGDNAKRQSYKHDLDDDVRKTSSSNAWENDKELYNVTKLYSEAENETENNLKQPKFCYPDTSRVGRKSRRTASSQKTNIRSSERPTYYSRRSKNSQQNAKYEMLIKIAEKWYEYMMKVLIWLFYLVYDIVVLGFGMIYDRMSNYIISMCSVLKNLRQDLRNNSGKPSAWINNLFKSFDSKFMKNSKWAFWRRFTEKKPSEPTTDYYENGRLPQTGDEAIYSLLNCKGKDAYSILGVSSESSQEQIRKHYKKIAMLVHPDKNKQPGAEEAFKVLQRAFELIGEPENRQTYDKSLAEQMDAKKQWSELHDLLSQLQQKIAEAANTIRCSSCGLRHPRVLTDRPAYAARQCSSCKIRHSAREGDIWLETTIFRVVWRYLALMEGKVYDITEWANCQKGALAYLQPDSHVVQYRIVRGVQEKQQHEKQSKERSKREFGKLLDNIYSGHNPTAQQNATTRRRTKRN